MCSCHQVGELELELETLQSQNNWLAVLPELEATSLLSIGMVESAGQGEGLSPAGAVWMVISGTARTQDAQGVETAVQAGDVVGLDQALCRGTHL